jgi:hypothetical protein
MSWVGSRAPQRGAAAPERAGPSAPRVERHRSLALAALMQEVPESGVRVLDLGTASGTNVEFLSRFASRIQIEDLYATLVAEKIAPEGDLPVGVLPEGERPVEPPPDFHRLLGFPESACFDLILAWDILDYLEREPIRALVGYLGRHLRSGGVMLALSSTTKQIPIRPLRYRFADSETLIYEFESNELRGSPRYTPRDFVQMMTGYRIQQSFLLKNSVQEYLWVRD